MNKKKKSREKCRNCEHFLHFSQATSPNKVSKHCTCNLNQEMIIDIFTHKPDWCPKDKPQVNDANAEAPETHSDTETVIGPIDVASE